MSEPTVVRQRLGDGLEHWVLSNPKRRNAVAPGMLDAIASFAATLRGQTVLLRGEGGEAFCAGFDLSALREHASTEHHPDQPLIAATTAMSQANATFVAVVNGYAIGAGVELVCACDLKIARRDAWFSVPAGRLGVVYHADGVARIRATFGGAITRRLLLLGERITAAEADRAGAFVRLVDATELDAAATEIAANLAQMAPMSVRGNRDLLRALDRGGLQDAERAAHVAVRDAAYASEDHAEARQAMAQGRPPRFRGR